MLPNTKICKICGKEYKYCKTESLKSVFRWRDVACCPEHGREYFRLVMESRSEESETDRDSKNKSSAKETKKDTDKNGTPDKAE